MCRYSCGMNTDTVIARFNFIQQAEKAALANTIATGETHSIQHDRETDTYLVIKVA